jgi:hypothetical protein
VSVAVDSSAVDIKALQDRNRRLEGSLLMAMGMIKSLHSSLHESLAINRRLELSLSLSQQALEQVLRSSSLEPEQIEGILELIRQSQENLPDRQQQVTLLHPLSPPEFASVDDFASP